MFVLICTVVFILFCNVCVCVWGGGYVTCGCFCNLYTLLTEVFLNLTEVFLNLTEVFLTLTEGFPCFFLSCKTNASVKLAKTGHRPHYSTFVLICTVVVLYCFVMCVCVCVCACVGFVMCVFVWVFW